MIKKFLFIGLIIIISCKSANDVYLCKDTHIADVPISPTIETFPWDNDFKGQRDSIFIKRKRKKELYRILNKLDVKDFNPAKIWTPEYAFILKYNSKKDTLYFDKDFTQGYLIHNDINLIDTTKILKKFLYKKYDFFFKRDLLYYERKYYPETLDY
jgi:hypothetical protein